MDGFFSFFLFWADHTACGTHFFFFKRDSFQNFVFTFSLGLFSTICFQIGFLEPADTGPAG
jgi:hypothetical protein